jgi:uncharacterized protein YcbX
VSRIAFSLSSFTRTGSQAHNRAGMAALTLAALNLYPVKSAAGIALAAARVDERGLAGDRRWMVVDSNRRFLTQRTHARLAMVSVGFAADGLTLAAPGMPALVLRPPGKSAAAVRVQVWDDLCEAQPAGGGAAEWISGFLGETCEIVHMPDETRRMVVAEGSVPASEVSFADAFPFLLLSEGSLEDLNRRLERPVPMNRFRPNLVVRGCAPYAEDGWRRIRIGAIEFYVVQPCIRCTTTTVDQATGERGREPLATLAAYRRDDNAVLFGQNLVHAGTGELRLGEGVTVLEAA